MPIKSLSNPSFIRPAEIMGADIQRVLAAKSEEVADMIARAVGSKSGNALGEARKLVAKSYREAGLVDANRARLVRIMNLGASEVSDSAALKRQKKHLNVVLDNVAGVVQKSADRYLDRIVLNKVAKVIGKGGGKKEVRAVVQKSMGDAEHYWKNVSNTATSRVFHYGSMIAAQGSGLKYCTYHAVLDERTTDFCKSIDGKRITLSNAILKAEEVLTKSSDDMIDTDFWAVAAELGEKKSLAIVKNGLTLPPFHGHCRTTTWFT